MNGVDHSRALTGQYSYRSFPSRSGVESYLPGERWVSPNTQVEPALYTEVCGKPEQSGLATDIVV